MKKWIYSATFVILAGISASLAIDGVYLDKPISELKPLYARAGSKFVDVDGLEVHYRDQGQGPTLLLLHGVNASLHTWAGWTDTLAQHFRVIALDLPGHGLTGPDPQKRYSWKESADFVFAFADAIKLDKFHVAGNSRGGAIAWHMALFDPERINKMILIDTAGLPWEEPLPLALQVQRLPVFKQSFLFITPKWIVNQSVDSVYGDPSKITQPIYDRYHNLLLREGNRQAASEIMTQTFSQQWFSDRLSEIQHPTLIQWGENDQWILLKYGQRIHELLPNSKMIVYPDVGHVPMEEIPNISAQDAKAFLM